MGQIVYNATDESDYMTKTNPGIPYSPLDYPPLAGEKALAYYSDYRTFVQNR
jgi:hypothetical protein